MALISIIIRTKNEERWIGHCLRMVFRQESKDFEIILVDNNSEDYTLEIAHRFPVAQILSISDYKPGLALNVGIRHSTGKYIACLSAHCVPESERWLSIFLKNFEDHRIAGVYGRQLPLTFSEPSDKRDLLIAFGLDRRVQIKDYFFHNANSMIRRDVWEQIPFDESVTNIEDRIWAKAVIDEGYRLAYEPEAAVYHHHGIHQNNDPQRAKNVVSVIEQVERSGDLNDLPESLKPENCCVAAVLPVLGEVKEIAGHNLLAELVQQLKSTRYVKSIYVFSECESAASCAQRFEVNFIPRPGWLLSKEKSIEDVLQYSLEEIERAGNYPDVILYANYLYPFRPQSLFDELIRDLQYRGLDTVFPGYRDYQNYWARTPDGNFIQVGESLKPREHKQPLYRSLYGLGCVTTAAIIRSGKLVGGRIGVLQVDNSLFTLKCSDEKLEELIAVIFRELGNFGIR